MDIDRTAMQEAACEGFSESEDALYEAFDCLFTNIAHAYIQLLDTPGEVDLGDDSFQEAVVEFADDTLRNEMGYSLTVPTLRVVVREYLKNMEDVVETVEEAKESLMRDIHEVITQVEGE